MPSSSATRTRTVGLPRDEITINPAAQHDLATHGGLCSFHTWQYEASLRPLREFARATLLCRTLMSWMRGAASDRDVQGLASKLNARLTDETSCVYCRVRAKAESEALVGSLSRQLTETQAQALYLYGSHSASLRPSRRDIAKRTAYRGALVSPSGALTGWRKT